MPRNRTVVYGLTLGMGLMLMLASLAAGQDIGDPLAASPDDEPGRQTLLSFIEAGGPIGLAIIALSIAAVGLVGDAFLRMRDHLMTPAGLSAKVEQLAGEQRFSEILTVCRNDGSMLARIIARSLPAGVHGLAAVREAMQEHGGKETHHLTQRVGYVGFIASVAPMLGLLGTVVGMIRSFNVLGVAQGAARPDELAIGISEALVTTCMGLIVAIPLLFFHSLLRDRVSRISLEASGACDRLLRRMTFALDQAGPGGAAVTAPAPAGPSSNPATRSPSPEA